MLDMYLFENSQLLEGLQDRVLKLKDAESFDDESINEIFRAIHTIKGSSAIMMFDEVTAVAHKLEDVFYYLRESKPKNVPHLELVELVLAVTDFISGEMDKLSDGGVADGKADDLIGKIDDFLQRIKASEDGAGKVIADNVYEEPTQFYIAPLASGFTHYYKVYITYNENTKHVNIHAFKSVRALKDVADDMLYYPEDILSGKEAVSEDINENGFKILIQTGKTQDEIKTLLAADGEIKSVDVYECNYAEFNLGFASDTSEILIDLDSSVEEIIERSEKQETLGTKYIPEEENIVPGDFVVKEKGHGKVTLARDKKSEARKSAYISVEVSKLDRLMELADKLVANEESEIALELQRAIKAMRVVPLTSTFQKMNRVVFDISRKQGKDVGFEMIGDTTEVDKNIVEHIADPLMHIVRNAVDHGIESPAEREMAGKTERAKITLSAGVESGEVWIRVEDNGRGLDREKILARAREQGYIDDPVKSDKEYSDKEVFLLITRPGFTTSENVTEYSGRGVGMDVVMQNIGDLGGTLEIESTKGFGTVFTMKFKKL
ncbi:MAG: Hpt domain-containing protein [Lachnospiraceae bacterium]|nr:Hpt domain-containing protein [Lachnospiraceae bacterium]